MATDNQKFYKKIKTDAYTTSQLVYPTDLFSTTDGFQHYILFNINETTGSGYTEKNRIVENPGDIQNPYGSEPIINKSDISARAIFGSAGSRLKESICLPMPMDIKTAYSVQYRNAEMGTAGRVANTVNSLSDVSIKDGLKIVGAEMLRTAKASTAKAVQSITGANVADLKELGTATKTNNMMEVLFSGVANRTPQFQFRFAPKNEKETDLTREIIRRFKFYQHPAIHKDSSNAFATPFTFDLSFMVGSERNQWLPRFSTCALQSVDVNYTDTNEYNIFLNDSPVTVVMDLIFTELEVLTQDKFEDKTGSF